MFARIVSASVIGLLLLSFAACSPAPAATPTATTAATPQPAPAASFDDPYAYCTAIGTIDTPDARYTGAAMPAALVQAMIQHGLISADAPATFQQSAVWRCMQGHVWICHFGANLPCQEKADTSQMPTAEMESFCAENPSADIPAAVAGRATIYTWGCQAGKPTVLSSVISVDPQGYQADIWYELAAP